MGKKKDYQRFSRLQIILVVLMVLAVVLVGAFFFVKERYKVTTVNVTGNQHYTVDQIKDIVMSGKYGDNSLYLHYKYKNKTIEDVPFVETMDVTIVSPSEISITVYEKAIAGYVEYLGHYMYFDKDGIVVESTLTQSKDLPYVTGLKFDHVVMYEKLPVENDEIFKDILSVTQLLSKYQISTDKIYFDSERNITLYFGQARVRLGSMDNIDEKMIKLQFIIPKLDGLSGVLYMENYTEESEDKFITFQRDDVTSHETVSGDIIMN